MTAKVSVDAIKTLRDKTSASLSDVRKALESSGGNEAKALQLLRERGAAIAETRQGKAAGDGRIEAYVHHDGKLAVLVEVNCETDFVARTGDFQQFCKDVAIQVAAMNPTFVRPEDAPAGTDAETVKASALLAQPFVKDAGTTVGELLNALVAKTGEKVLVRRFVRFAVGETA